MSWLKTEHVECTMDEKRVILHWGNWPHLVYHYRPSNNRPYIGTLIGPSGRNMLEDTPADHVHHHGVWWGHGDVNGVDFYLEDTAHQRECGTIDHVNFTDVVRECPTFAWTDNLEWHATMMVPFDESRRISVQFVDESHYIVDLDSTYKANHEIRFGDTKESSLPGIRVAENISGLMGGTIVNSRGGVGERECMGQSAEWIDYSNMRTWIHKEGSGVEGIACLDHPDNPHHPPKFFAREYGPFCAFQGHWFIGTSRLEVGNSLRFRHRLIVHAGDHKQADIAGHYERYAAIPS